MIKLLMIFLVMTINFSMDVFTDPVSDRNDHFARRSIPYDDNYEHFVTGLTQEENKRLIVNYKLKEKDIYIECFIKDFIFSKDNVGSVKKEGEGHIHLYINDAKVDSIFKSSFIIKSLPSGTYRIRLELIHNDYTPYEISEEFEITL